MENQVLCPLDLNAKPDSHYGDIISVRNKNFGLPFRQYIWQGGTSKQDLNGDGLFKKLDNDPRTTGDVVDPIDENAVPWCFAYGEEEWMARKGFGKIKALATGTAIKSGIGRVNCVTGVSL